MLQITYRIPTATLRQYREWHIGEDLPPFFQVEDVFSVQADCDELDHILFHSEGLPHVAVFAGMQGNLFPVQRWYGDHAKWIVGNLLKKGTA